MSSHPSRFSQYQSADFIGIDDNSAGVCPLSLHIAADGSATLEDACGPVARFTPGLTGDAKRAQRVRIALAAMDQRSPSERAIDTVVERLLREVAA